MKKYALTFGFVDHDLMSVRELVEQRLQVTFEDRYSEHYGGAYLRASRDDERVHIQLNQELRGEIAEEDFPGVVVLLIVDWTSFPETVKDAMKDSGAVLIREQSCDL
jgi:hypothetical protein